MVIGKVNNVLAHSLVDGPGNRSVVFLQGCSFHCLYCHNPYTIHHCNHCGECVAVCPAKALRLMDRRVVWDPALCTACDACTDICTHFSSPRIKEMTPEELWDSIRPTSAFISGVTVSGGEPFLQPDFVLEFLHLIKNSSNLTTCIETNGNFSVSLYERFLPVLDHVLLDLKAWDTGIHKALTGKGNEKVLQSLQFLAEHGKLTAVRQVIVPGYTDTQENIEQCARFITNIDPEIPFHLLRFRPHGTNGQAETWQSPSDQTMETLVNIARQQGLKTVEQSL